MTRIWYSPTGPEPKHPWSWCRKEETVRNWILAGAEVVALPKDATELRKLAKAHKVKVVNTEDT